MKCTKCGHKLRIGDEFCSKCGTPIEPDIVFEERDARTAGRREDARHTDRYRDTRTSDRRDDTRVYRHEDGSRDGSFEQDDYYRDIKRNRANEDEYDFEKEFRKEYKKIERESAGRPENEHDITGTIHLDPQDTAPKKASKWTVAGIAAAVGIAAAFVIAVISINVQNIMKSNEEDLIREAEETTTSTTVRETTTAEPETTSGSSWKNPFESLFPSQDKGSSSGSGSSSNEGDSRNGARGSDNG